jgi:hypothetical protein
MTRSETLKKLWEDPKFKEKMKMKRKEYYSIPENREKLIAMGKKGWDDPVSRQKHSENLRAALSTPEQRERMRQQAIKVHSDPIIKQKHLDAIHAFTSTVEFRKQCSIRQKKRYLKVSEREKASKNLRDVSIRLEVKQKLSESRKRMWQDPTFKEKARNERKKRWQDPLFKEKMSDIHKKRCEDPKIRENLLKILDKCRSDPLIIKKQSDETKRALSNPDYRLSISGKNSHMYKNGSSYFPYCYKFNKILKLAVRKFFGFQCVLCNKLQSENIVTRKGIEMEFPLAVHHIDHKKEQGCTGMPFNLVPLCTSCHSKEQHHIEIYQEKINKILDDGFSNGKWNRELYDYMLIAPKEFI